MSQPRHLCYDAEKTVAPAHEPEEMTEWVNMGMKLAAGSSIAKIYGGVADGHGGEVGQKEDRERPASCGP